LSQFTVLCCRTAGSADGPAGGTAPTAGPTAGPDALRPAGSQTAGADDVRDVLLACGGRSIHFVGRRPGKAIDPLLAGRILVVGDDADLAAVVLRLLRRELLGAVEVAYAAASETPVTSIWSMPTGPEAVTAADRAEVDLVPLVRSDAGGVLVGAARLAPVSGTVYVDEQRVLSGNAQLVQVEPDRDRGLAVTVVRRRILGFGRRPVTALGRAVEFGLGPGTDIVIDGVRHPRAAHRWVFYKHTQPLRLVRGVY
jgi:hypothetical protein